MTPARYDAWYDTPRGLWVGETELRLLSRLLARQPGESLLDIGCGTGWFTRRFATAGGGLQAGSVIGLDLDPASLAFARDHGHGERYLDGDALALPFVDRAFDLTVSVTALCFVPDWPLALAEMARVTRRRLVVGLLNRHSLLWREKGRGGEGGGTGGYRGARWHHAAEVHAALADLGLTRIRVRTALFLPGGTPMNRLVERIMPGALPWGGFLVLAADRPDSPKETDRCRS